MRVIFYLFFIFCGVVVEGGFSKYPKFVTCRYKSESRETVVNQGVKVTKTPFYKGSILHLEKNWNYNHSFLCYAVSKKEVEYFVFEFKFFHFHPFL